MRPKRKDPLPFDIERFKEMIRPLEQLLEPKQPAIPTTNQPKEDNHEQRKP